LLELVDHRSLALAKLLIDKKRVNDERASKTKNAHTVYWSTTTTGIQVLLSEHCTALLGSRFMVVERIINKRNRKRKGKKRKRRRKGNGKGEEGLS
jgi:hypothetical protein